MNIWTPFESKLVGWDEDIIEKPPTLDEVEKFDRIQLLTNFRFLSEGAPREIVDRIVERLKETFPKDGLAESSEVVQPEQKYELDP